MFEDRGQIDRGRVTADADGVNGAGRRSGGNYHEAQRQGREAPDQTQCPFSAFDVQHALQPGRMHPFV
jgi:flavin-dependent dehydrogenase